MDYDSQEICWGPRLSSSPNVPPIIDTTEEEYLLGALMFSAKSHYIRGLSHITAGHFFNRRNRAVWQALVSMANRTESFEFLEVLKELERLELLEDVGPKPHAYLSGLLDGHWKGERYQKYAEILEQRHRKWQVSNCAYSISTDVLEGMSFSELQKQIAGLGKVARETEVFLPTTDIAEILSRDSPKTPWAIEGLLAEGDVGIVSGAGGIGKSWLGLMILMALAMGDKLFGYYVKSRRYKVAALDLESRTWEIDQRLHRLAAGLRIGPGDLAGHMQIIRRRIRLDHPEDLARLMRFLEATGTEFLLVDSFRRATRGDENASGDVSRLFTEVLDRIRLELGCGVLLIDHHRKRTGDRDLDAADQALRGSTDKLNMADMHVGIEVRENRLAWFPTKTRHSRRPEPILLEIDGLAQDDQEQGPVVIRFAGHLDRASDKAQDAILALLAEAGTGWMERGQIIARVHYSKRTVSDGLSNLKRRNLLRRTTKGKKALYGLKEPTKATKADECKPERSA